MVDIDFQVLFKIFICEFGFLVYFEDENFEVGFASSLDGNMRLRENEMWK